MSCFGKLCETKNDKMQNTKFVDYAFNIHKHGKNTGMQVNFEVN